jgi:hypothetical protein
MHHGHYIPDITELILNWSISIGAATIALLLICLLVVAVMGIYNEIKGN